MKTRIVILAAGRSSRMKSETPKLLLPVGGKPMIMRVFEAAVTSGVDTRPVVVVGSNAQALWSVVGERAAEYVIQEMQLGTGHAVQSTESFLRGKADAVLVLYGDNCMIGSSTIRQLAETHEKSGAVLTMLTTTIPDFEEWRKPFNDFGRIVRDTSGTIARIVEKKDATPQELAIKELNPSFFCFEAKWLWENLHKLKNNNAQKEYYLTDLVEIAIADKRKIETIFVSPEEVLGVNTQEQLEIVRGLT